MSTFSSQFVADFGPHRGRMDGGFGHPGLFVFGILLLAGVITAIVLLVRGNRHPAHLAGALPVMPVGPAPMSPTASAETILSERLARGEVSVEDFVAARAALRGEWSPAPAPVPAPPPPPATATGTSGA